MYPLTGCFPDTSAFSRQAAGKYRGTVNTAVDSLRVSRRRTEASGAKKTERKTRRTPKVPL